MRNHFYFSQQHGVPVVAFTASYLGLGAAAVLDIDRTALGRQARELVDQLLEGGSGDNMSLRFPKGVTLKTNASLLKRLNINDTLVKQLAE